MSYFFFFFFNDTATTEIYTLSLHDALPIWRYVNVYWTIKYVAVYEPMPRRTSTTRIRGPPTGSIHHLLDVIELSRSEEHTSELQSRLHLVCRLLLEKKK